MSTHSRRDFLAVASSLGVCAWPRLSRSGGPTAQARADDQEAARPNILFFFPDQLRYDWIGGNAREIPVQTPNLDGLTREGAYFRRAVVPSPVCAPSRASIASGKEYERCRVPSNAADYPLDQPTVYGLLRDQGGYHVAGVGKFDLSKATHDWGLDGRRHLKAWGFSDGINNAGKGDGVMSGMKSPQDPYMAYLYRRDLAALYIEDMLKRGGGKNPGGGSYETYAATWPTPLPEDAYCDNWLATNGLELMERFPTGKPWFLQLNFVGPHVPSDITPRMADLVRGRVFPQPHECKVFAPDTHLSIRQNYTAMVENIDRWLGIYMDALRQRGELEHTLIVFSSDHGEMLGDHNRWAKSVPYHPSIGVPLLVSGPGVQHGLVSDAPVSTVDLTATFLDYAGVSRPADMDSRSLRPLLEGRTEAHRGAHRAYVSSGLGPWRMVFDGRYKWVRGFDPDRERIWQERGDRRRFVEPPDGPVLLFDLDDDPLENMSLV